MRRVVSVFFCFIFTFALLLVHLFRLATNPVVPGGSIGGSVTLQTAIGRGFIYDRNGLPFVNEQMRAFCAAGPTERSAELLKNVTTDADYEAATQRFAKGLPALVPVTDNVYGEGIRMVYQPQRYAPQFLIAHLAGYCDSTGHGVCGLEKSFDALLTERKSTITYPVDALGRVLCGEQVQTRDEGVLSPRGVILTLEKSLQATVREQMLRSGIRKGAAVLLDAGTGEIRAMVSVPEFNVENPGESLSDADGPFLNRALQAVSVGSVYKMIVAAAAIESGVSENYTYTCEGYTVQDDITFHCHQRSGHGKLTMPEAMYNSCNPWFISLSSRVSAESLLSLSWKVGLGSPNSLAQGLSGAAGILPDEAELSTNAAKANLFFGQGKLTATPLQIAAATAVFANGGYYREPTLIRGTVREDGERLLNILPDGQRVVSEDTADRVRKLLVFAASETERLQGIDCGGKTATAQSGEYKNGREKLNTWYSGFFPAENPKYVLTILCEDGESGSQDCIPVFREIVRNILIEKYCPDNCQ